MRATSAPSPFIASGTDLYSPSEDCTGANHSQLCKLAASRSLPWRGVHLKRANRLEKLLLEHEQQPFSRS